MSGAPEPFGELRGSPIGPVRSFDGTELHVEELGAGPTSVFVHGFCLQIPSWHYQMRDLASERRLVLFEQRGHGRSARPVSGDWSMEAFARDLAWVLDAIAADGPVTLVGHSMGGMSILQFCAMFPERLGTQVGAVVLTDTSDRDVVKGMLPGALKLATPAIRLLEEAAIRAAGSRPDAFDRVRDRLGDLVALMVKLMGFGPKAPAEELAFVAKMLSGVPAEVLVPVFQTLRRLDVCDGLADLDVPALVMVGSRDRLTPPARAERIATAIPHAEFSVIRGAGHMPMLEKPDVFNGLLRNFLANPGAVYAGRRVGRP